MKAAILSLILFFSVNRIEAQTKTGSIMTGGNFNVSLQLIKNSENSFTLNLNPNYGVFIKDDFAIGASFGFGYFAADNFSNFSFSISPFFRSYFGPEGNTRFFIEANGGLIYLRRNDGFGRGTNTELMFSAGPGVSFFISKNVSLDAQLIYIRRTGEDNILFASTRDNSIGVYFGFQVFLDGENKE